MPTLSMPTLPAPLDGLALADALVPEPLPLPELLPLPLEAPLPADGCTPPVGAIIVPLWLPTVPVAVEIPEGPMTAVAATVPVFVQEHAES